MTKFTTHMSYEQAAVFYVPPDNSVLISIRDESEWTRPECPRYVDRLALAFHDIGNQSTARNLDDWLAAGYVPPHELHAKQIAAFIRKHWDRNVIVHCEAGISRSAAVAEICRRLGWELKHPMTDSTMHANPRLLKLLVAEFPELQPYGIQESL